MNLPKFNEGIHFATATTYQNKPYFLDKRCCNILVEELKFYRERYRFKISGYVIMPEHLHLLIWWDKENNKKLTISKIMQGIKGHSAIRIRDYLKSTGRLKPLLQPDESRGSHLPHKRGLRYKIWQKGFYDFNVLFEEKLWEKLDYIHENPFKDKRIKSPENYLYSSYSFYETGKSVLAIDSE